MDISELKRIKETHINRHPWELSRLHIIKHFLKKKTKSYKHLLDFGSGDAFILNELQKEELASKYTAVDSAFSDAILDAIQRDGVNKITFCTSLPPAFDQKADGVLILDVLEHCEDDHSVLSNLLKTELLKYNALIIITVPAFQWLFSEHDLILGHYRRYNRKSLIRLCKQNNLQVVESGYFFFTLFIIRMLQLLRERITEKKLEKTIDNWEGSKWVTKTISAILSIDFFITSLFSKIGIRIPGLSVYCLCRF